MTSVDSERPPENFNNPVDVDILGVEDCQYLLRVLERRAFEYVVSALRAQGPLSQYKEIILDHLKTIFCISDEDFLLRIRITSSDPILTKIAQELNPSYDTYMEWHKLGLKPDDIEFSEIIKLGMEPNKQLQKFKQQMISKMQKHNESIEAEKEKLSQLIYLPKRPYVPEKLRRLLLDTEEDVSNRVDIIREKVREKETNKLAGGGAPISNKPVLPTRHVGRPRRSEIAAAENEHSNKNNKFSLSNSTIKDSKILHPQKDTNNDSNRLNSSSSNANSLILLANSTTPNTFSMLKENGNNLQKQKQIGKIDEIQKNKDEFSVHYSAGAKTVVIDPEDQNSGKESKHKKKRSKLMDDGTFVCARVQPFLFPPAIDGQPKPTRGNPDKRTTKRPINPVFNSNPNESLYSSPSLANTFYANTYLQEDYVINKRNRTTSTAAEICDSRLNFSKSLSSISKASNVISGTPTHYTNQVRSFVGSGGQIVSSPSMNSRFAPNNSSTNSSSTDLSENHFHHYRTNIGLPLGQICSTYTAQSSQATSTNTYENSSQNSLQPSVVQIAMIHEGGGIHEMIGRSGLECNEQIIFEPTTIENDNNKQQQQHDHFYARKPQQNLHEMYLQQQPQQISLATTTATSIVQRTPANPKQIHQIVIEQQQQPPQAIASFSAISPVITTTIVPSSEVAPVTTTWNTQSFTTNKNEQSTSSFSSSNLDPLPASTTTSIQRIITTGTTILPSISSSVTTSAAASSSSNFEASALDFLASTASLFTKMQRGTVSEPSPTTIIPKVPITPQITTTVYSQEAPNSSSRGNNCANKNLQPVILTTTTPNTEVDELSTSYSVGSSGNLPAVVIPSKSCSTTKSYQQQHVQPLFNENPSTSTTIDSTSNRHYHSTMIKPITTTNNIPPSTSSSLKSYANSNQATQDFFKQQMDNGVIDQGITLGSILANPNLRSKLFNAAANQSPRD